MSTIRRQEKLWSNRAQTWEYIENRFRTDFGGGYTKIIELVQYIRNSGLAGRLYGYKSMDKLVISIYDTIDPRKDALHISFDLNFNKWHFEYFAKPFVDPEFVRNYPAEEGLEKFDNFLKMIRW